MTLTIKPFGKKWVCSTEYGERWANVERRSAACAVLAAIYAVEYPLDGHTLDALEKLEEFEKRNDP